MDENEKIKKYNYNNLLTIQKLLREKCSVDVEVRVFTRPTYCVSIIDKNSSIITVYNLNGEEEFSSYEEALYKGVLYVLENDYLCENLKNT